MKTVAIVVAILIILLVVVLVVLAARRNRRRAVLRDRFGPEYDLALRHGKDRRAVEQRLEAVADQRDSLRIRDVPLEEHERFAERWADVQGRFVDDPGQAVADADGLVNAVLRSRGYPVESFDDRVALVATDHQDIVEGYRTAHDTYADHLQTGSGETERLRQAFLHYREVFGRLNTPAGPSRDQGRALESGEAPRAVESSPATEAPAPAVAAEPVPAEAPAPAVPAEPVPAEPVPAEPVHAEPVPAEPVPAEPVPGEPVPAERAGSRPIGVDTAAAPAEGPRETETESPADAPDGDRVAAVRLDEAEAGERSGGRTDGA